MAIILGILKILGIVVLIILGIMLCFLFCVLFGPICYRLEGSYKEQCPYAKGSVSFFGPFLKVTFGYIDKEGLWYRVRLLFFTLFSNDSEFLEKKQRKQQKKANAQKVRKQQKEEKQRKKKAKIQQREEQKERKRTDTKQQEEKEVKEKLETLEKEKSNLKCDAVEGKEDNSKMKNTAWEQEKKITKQKKYKKKRNKKTFFQWIREKMTKLLHGFKNKWKRFCKVKKKIQLLIKLKNAETTKLAYKAVKKECAFVVKHCKPRKVKGEVAFGFKDPCQTGEVLAVCGVLYPLFRDKIQVIPYFEEPLLRAEIALKGHIQIVFIAVAACKIYTNKFIKKTIERWERITGGK